MDLILVISFAFGFRVFLGYGEGYAAVREQGVTISMVSGPCHVAPTPTFSFSLFVSPRLRYKGFVSPRLRYKGERWFMTMYLFRIAEVAYVGMV